ncbi:CpsD/CapB family tyrosine-protein kinase [Altericroceibacterium xinjiangense]|uniref:CpsD/CapB family tyrosine-protein kinase n=1 Tax=Altericroceibacterium xinjiangense TaxID=762261 RepID=UPI000F7F8B9A|nr:CpsD/CapB family tyrosine-protein kinase [Altericroceibacterium xinjiangense]
MSPEIEMTKVHLLGRGPGGSARTSLALDRGTLAANRIVGFEPMDENAQSFFQIRSALLNHAQATGQRIFAVTSGEPRNGKTHVAVNLAAALSRIHPTVLVELDMRQPSVGQRLGLPSSPPGVDDYLAGETGWCETRVQIEGFDLGIHRVRKRRHDAETLLNSTRLANALRLSCAAEGRPICIVDTPPAIMTDDLVLIARAVDGFLLVAQEARTRKRGLLDVVSALSPTPVIGSVLNMSISSPAPRVDYGCYYSSKNFTPAAEPAA